MRALARRVGVTATTLYHYYASKNDLLRRVKLGAAERLNRRIRAIESSLPPEEVLHRLGREYLAFAEEQPGIGRCCTSPTTRPARRWNGWRRTAVRGWKTW